MLVASTAVHWVDSLVVMSDGLLVAHSVLLAVMLVVCSVVTTVGSSAAHLVMLDVMLVEQWAHQKAGEKVEKTDSCSDDY